MRNELQRSFGESSLVWIRLFSCGMFSRCIRMSPENPFSNRPHNSREREAGEEILAELVQLLRPRILVAVGNDAERTANRVASKEMVMKVQHPSYGGQPIFLRQMAEFYDL